jgi:pimeloyl-ACP methyl ester carboxylesterase
MTGPAALLAHVVEGQGPPLLLLNGGTMSMGAWDAIARPLESKYRVVRCDLRGQLLSPGVPPPTFAGHALDVVALLDHLALDRVHVAGASFGALTGLVLAAEHPSRVRSLAAFTTTDRVTAEMWAGAEAIRGAAKAAAAGGDGGRVFDLLVSITFSEEWRRREGEGLERRRKAVSMLPPVWFSGLAGLMDNLRGVDLREDVRRIACPTLVVAAGQDLTFPPEHSRSLVNLIPDARLVMIDDAPHGLIAERAEQTSSLIDAFVAEVESGSWRSTS